MKMFAESPRFEKEKKVLGLIGGEEFHIISILDSILKDILLFKKYDLEPFSPQNDSERIEYMHQVLLVIIPNY